MHTRAAVAVLDAEANNKIVTAKVTSGRSMSRPAIVMNSRRFIAHRRLLRCGISLWLTSVVGQERRISEIRNISALPHEPT